MKITGEFNSSYQDINKIPYKSLLTLYKALKNENDIRTCPLTLVTAKRFSLKDMGCILNEGKNKVDNISLYCSGNWFFEKPDNVTINEKESWDKQTFVDFINTKFGDLTIILEYNCFNSIVKINKDIGFTFDFPNEKDMLKEFINFIY